MVVVRCGCIVWNMSYEDNGMYSVATFGMKVLICIVWKCGPATCYGSIEWYGNMY